VQGRKRPDLRRDCDPLKHLTSIFTASVNDGKDLIYEGIATAHALDSLFHRIQDGKDLIYEGIATLPLSSQSLSGSFLDGKDLIYEGIATPGIPAPLPAP